MIRCSNLLRKENIRRSALHECDWPCQQKDDRCDLRCPPGWTTVPTCFTNCRLTELRHFHSARKGSGSLRPFPIYPLYTQTVILSLDKPIADCFLFRPRKSCEKRRKRSHTNAFLYVGHTDFNTFGTATTLGCGNLFFCYSVAIFAPLPVWSTTGIINQDY